MTIEKVNESTLKETEKAQLIYRDTRNWGYCSHMAALRLACLAEDGEIRVLNACSEIQREVEREANGIR